MGNLETSLLSFVIDKVVMPGKMPCGYKGLHRKVFCRIAYNTARQLERNTHIRKNGDAFELSISGVVGPYSGGNCYGSCGQLQEELLAIDQLNVREGWNRSMIDQFVRYWQKYHLNGTNSGCVHQDEWDTGKEIDAYSYNRGKRHDRIKQIVESGLCVDFAEYKAMTDILAKVRFHLFDKPFNGSPKQATGDMKMLLDEKYVTVSGVKKEQAGFVYFDRHPEGLLAKPCPKCGHTYGTSHVWRPVPPEVLEWLAALPETEEEYAWCR